LVQAAPARQNVSFLLYYRRFKNDNMQEIVIFRYEVMNLFNRHPRHLDSINGLDI
jgi:hypothetical protein